MCNDKNKRLYSNSRSFPFIRSNSKSERDNNMKKYNVKKERVRRRLILSFHFQKKKIQIPKQIG